ncbi:Auxin-binding protein ABP19a, partial [Mucuna pruriens]
MKNIVLSLFFLAVVSSTTHASKVNDFCVANLKAPDSPSGYQCLPPNGMTADNFVFSFKPENTSNPIKVGVSTAFVKDFPGLNGLGISAVRVSMDKGGFIPMHTHEDATELIMTVEGEIIAGFVTATKAYVKTLKPGDLMVIPQGLLHFVVNSGRGKSFGFAAFSSSNPSVHSFNQIFANNIPSNILAQTTFLDVAQVKKLKALFDLKGPDSPSGYQCLPPNTLTADNFVFSLQPANTSNPIKAGISTAFVKDFPALNGLDISAVRVIMDKGGYFPMHTHRGATELIIMVEGEITAGFVTATKAYVKTLKPGDLMVIPQGQLHFVLNSGAGKATVFAAFSSSNPGVHSFNQIFANNVPSPILAQTTFLDVAQVKKLKALFGGTN